MKPLRNCLSLLLLFCIMNAASAYGQRIGEWTSYLAYTSIRHVVDAGDRIYAASPKGLFYYDNDDFTVHPMSKGNGLSDVGVATIAYDAASRSLVVAYNNGNIDIIQNDITYNVSGIKQWVYTGDKSINAISFHNGRAYLACGFGLVVVSMQRKEIEDTYFFSDANNANSTVYDIAFSDTKVFIATSKGILHSNANNPYLNIEDTWTTDTSSIWDTMMPLKIEVFNEGLAILSNAHNREDRTLLFAKNNKYVFVDKGRITSLRTNNSHLVVSMWDSVLVYSNTLQCERVISEFSNGDILAHDAVEASDGRLLIAHEWGGLVVVDADGSSFSTSPEGPASDNVFRIRSITGGIAVCPGGRSVANSNLYINGNLYRYKNKEWKYLDKNKSNIEFYDVLDVTENPADSRNLSAASWGYGILDIKDDVVQNLYDGSNSDGALQPLVLHSFSTLNTGAVAYDWEGNLWMLNSTSSNGLVVHYSDGSWRAFNTEPIVRGGVIYNLLFDTVTGFLWFSGRDNRIYVHNGGDKMAWIDPNEGSKLTTSSVNCMVQDQNGHLWIGTDKGVKVIYDGYKAFENGGDGEMSPVACSNIIFSEGEIVEYLLAYESVTSIAVDGANRKWIGTAAGGLYLLSATGLEQLENFTVSNSPLFSNKIIAVGIHPVTGEVFVGSDMGLQSFRSTATYASTKPEKKIHVFPNPVKPDYDGPVAFRGFTRNAIVHITDEAGHVVYSTRADGGQAIWYIRNNNGVRVSSGVYFVFASDEEGHNKSVGKVLVIK